MSEKITLQETAYRELMERIVSGRVRMGEPLREESLARELDLSATPVREALRRLEREGWVEMVPYRGCFLRNFSAADIRELFFLRLCLEPEATMLAADAPDLGFLDEAAAALRREYELITAPEVVSPQVVDNDLDFHRLLLRGAAMPRVTDTILTLQKQTIGICCCLRMTDTREEALEYHHEHEAVLAALRKRQRNLVRELTRVHIEQACNRMLAFVAATR